MGFLKSALTVVYGGCQIVKSNAYLDFNLGLCQ